MWDLFSGLARRLLVGRATRPEGPRYAFCETTLVSGAVPFHIRTLDGSGGPVRLVTSGSDRPLYTLCQLRLAPGSRDRDTVVTPQRVASRHITCERCALVLRVREPDWKDALS